MNLAVFLDRDGVLVRAAVRDGRPYPPSTFEDLEILPEARTACRALRNAGFLLIAATNQPDVARGDARRADVEAMNVRVREELALDAVYACFHDDADECDCRKPKPGLLTRAASDYGVDLSGSYMVGDRWRDIEAGSAAGCHTIFIDYSYAERRPADPSAVVRSTAEAAQWILRRDRAKIARAG